MEVPGSCDTFVALPPATANGCVIFGKNSDRPANEVQEVVYCAATQNDAGSKVQCTYIDIDQAPKTLAVILSKPAWMWGAEMGANEAGVCIGNEAVWTKLSGEDDLTERLLGMDLLRLGLERGSTARESLDVITSLLAKHGQGGTCYEDSKFVYHNSFIIADPSEAWVLETAGKYWAAEKVTAGVRNISNQLSITKMDLCSPALIEQATAAGLYKPEDGEFSFAGVFGKDWEDKTKAESAARRFTCGGKLLNGFSKDGKFSIQDMMKILRDVESGICMSGRTTGSQVSVLSPGASVTPCCHWLTATPDPNTCLFKPFIFGPHPDIGSSTISPDYGNEDPRKVLPRFQRTVDRGHELYKGHEKLLDLVGKDDPTANMVLQNIQELEKNCIGDMDEILANYNEESFSKVSGLFKHMCDIEMNFYKMIHSHTGDYFEDRKDDGSIIRHHKIIQLPKSHVTFETEGNIELIDMLEEEGPPREAMEVEDVEEVMADGTVHTTHKVHTHALKHIRKSLKTDAGKEDLLEEKDIEVAGTAKDTVVETFTQRPKSVTEIKEEEVLEDGTKVKRQVVLSSMVQKIRTRSKSFDDSGKELSSDEYEIEEILPGTQSCFVARDVSSSSSSSMEELEADIQETEETFVDGTKVMLTHLEAKETRKSRSRSGSLERSEDTYTIQEQRITPSHTPRSGSPVEGMDDDQLLKGLQSISKTTKTGHFESTTHTTKDSVETTSDLKTETFVPKSAIKESSESSKGTATFFTLASRLDKAPKSCDTFVALPPTTANGCVIFGKNSDRPGREVQEVIYCAAAEHAPGSKLQCTFIEINQAPKILAVVLSKPAWMWGAEMGANEAGVCIGNEAVWTNLNSEDDLVERLLGMDLLRLGLERGSTARESVDVITSLLSQYGQGGTCMEGGQWSYHNSFIISDRSEAWVLETAGKYWAAERVTEGVRNISNELSITTKMDLKSPNLVEEATKAKLYSPADGEFNFAKVFSEYYTDPALARHGRFGGGRRLLKEYSKDGTFGPKDMMKILRDDDTGINMGSGTTGSQVSVISPPGSNTPCCHWLTATPDPSTSMFKPFIFGDNPGIGKYTASPDFGEEDPRKVKPRFKKRVDRRHELYKEQAKISTRGDAKILKNIQDLENKCIDDMDEILKKYDEQSYSKVANLFDHMCQMEINFYKG